MFQRRRALGKATRPHSSETMGVTCGNVVCQYDYWVEANRLAMIVENDELSGPRLYRSLVAHRPSSLPAANYFRVRWSDTRSGAVHAPAPSKLVALRRRRFLHPSTTPIACV